MTHLHGGHILTKTFKLKKSLEISMHLDGIDINFSFAGEGKKILILCKIYTPELRIGHKVSRKECMVNESTL